MTLEERIRQKQIRERSQMPDAVREFQEAEAERAQSRRIKPWNRRAWAWILTGHKVVKACLAIGVTFTAVNIYIKKLVITTSPALEASISLAVHQAVQKEFVDMQVQIKELKDSTGGLPEWRRDTTIRVDSLETREAITSALSERTYQQVDNYLIRSQRH